MVDDGRRFREHDGDRIEAHFVPGDSRFGCITAGRSRDVPLFRCVDCPVGCPELGGTAGFHLDKYDNIAVSRHNVNFGLTAARTIVPGQNSETCTAQIAMSIIFSLSAESRFRSETASFTELSGSIAYLPEELPRSDGPS